jgi:serine/threonine protein kinase
MPITVQCPNPKCRMSASMAEEHLGGRVRCPGCGQGFTPSPSRDGSAPPSARSPEAAAPLTVDRYEILEKLGSGAFGTVYRAYDPRLAREVALKVLHPEAFVSRQAVERFQREAQSMARLHHPHIVPVHDAGQSGRHHFIASALIRGRTLASAIPGDGMAPRRAVRLAIQLVEALAYAHKQGVLHRDVKPANVLLDEEDSLFLMDFGLAGQTEPSAARMTKMGALLGTPAYMAPEQARGDLERVGPGADLYSAGVVLFEMLTGRPPFEGPLEALVYNAIHTTPPPPSQYRPGLDAELEAVCLKALAKHPEECFAGGQEMAAALQGWLLRPEMPRKLPEKQQFRPPPLPAPRSGKAPGNPNPGVVFKAQTVPPARPVSPRDTILEAQIQVGEPSPTSARKAAMTNRSTQDRRDKEKSGGSVGAILGLQVCAFLILGALGGAAGLIYALQQKKTNSADVAETTPEKTEDTPRKPPDKPTEPKPSDKPTDLKPLDKPTDLKPSDKSTEPKPSEKPPPPESPPAETGELQPLAPVKMEAGKSVLVPISVVRKGFVGRLSVRVVGLPPGVSARPASIAEGKNSTEVMLVAESTAPATKHNARLQLWSDRDRLVVSGELDLAIVPAREGVETVAALCNKLEDAQGAERSRVLAALRKMGPAARKAGETVANLLRAYGRNEG